MSSLPLPVVEFRGPDIPGPIDPETDLGTTENAFWVLTANVPEFHRKKESSPQEDRVHTLRTLLTDVTTGDRDGLQWRMPRLMSLHLIAGALGRFAEDKEGFFVRLPKKSDELASVKSDKAVFHTVGDEPNKAGFQQVIAQPIFDLDRWPALGNDTISTPPFRLVAGAIELRLTGEALKWLGPLSANRDEVVVRLTPDGIELQAKVTFPGTADPIEGYFLLYPTASGTRLRLLSDRLKAKRLEAAWRTAWNAVTPKQGDERSIGGLEFEPRREGLVPQFEWDASTTKKTLDKISRVVDVPAADIRMRLVSPAGRHGVDGEVTLKPDVYHLAPFDRSLMAPRIDALTKAWSAGPTLLLMASMPGSVGSKQPATRMVIDALPKKVHVALESTDPKAPAGHGFAHDEVALARALRAAQGLDELLPGRNDPDHPLLAAFIPLDDGWLQLAVPNLPPPDLTKDDIRSGEGAAANVLSGYLRYAQSGDLPAVLSAFPDTDGLAPFSVTEAPWVVSIEGAQSLDFVVGMAKDGDSAKLVHAAASLDGPELSTRGLVWISLDRPDALEALPRLGAGAGAYFDIPLETFDIEKKPIVQFTVTKLAFDVDMKGTGELDLVSRDDLALRITFDRKQRWIPIAQNARKALDAARAVLLPAAVGSTDPIPPVVWRRHPRMPLAAAMPMTRGASSAVRPLESRDLVPFTIGVPDKDPLPIATVEWKSKAVFPDVKTHDGSPLSLRPIAAWPWPLDGELKSPDGIPLVAFGVPGAEVALLKSNAPSADPWSQLRFALRFDLPALDEAFATATLPPQPPDNALPEERELPPPIPTPLAYDWPSMAGFWAEQNRAHQLARVHHSYLAPYRAIADGSSKSTKVTDLIGGATWNPKIGFQQGDGNMPYGKADIDGQVVSDDIALRGVSGMFTVSGADVSVNQTVAPSNLVGYAPASFAEGDFLMDSRRTGMKKAIKRGGNRLLWRAISIAQPKTDIDALVTSIDPLKVGDQFLFWFKDLPVFNHRFTPPPKGIDFSAWQDGQLPRSGFEWRLVPNKVGDPIKIFKSGRDRIPFFGFALEPLRLASLELEFNGDEPTGNVKSTVIRARLHLGPSPSGPGPDANLVELTLEKDGDGKLKITGFDGADLQFAFAAAEIVLSPAGISPHVVSPPPRRVSIKGRVKWGGTQPLFTITDFTLAMFGADQSFEAQQATLTPQAATDKLKIEWIGTAATSPVPGGGQFVVEKITVTTDINDGGEIASVAGLSFTRRLVITPRGPLRGTATPPSAAIEAVLTAAGVESLRIVRMKIANPKADFVEGDGALTLTVNDDVTGQEIVGAGAEIGRGLPVQGHFSFGVACRLNPPVNGSMELVAGWLDGEIVAAKEATFDPRISLQRVAFHAEQRLRARKGGATLVQWAGGIRFYGSFKLDNAIGWPGIQDGGVLEPITAGTTVVTIDPATFHTHKVEYMLDGHQLPFDVAARIDSALADAVWTVPVMSQHTLTNRDSGKTATFTAVETFALGTATAIIPPLGASDANHPEHSFKEDPVTFGARHREKVDLQGNKTNKIADGMVLAGAGRIATVLSGALGLPFRKTFGTRSGLFLAGGFAGVIDQVDGDSGPFVRLPVLVAIDKTDDFARPGFVHGKSVASQVKVAWADGRAARNVIATLRGAITPASPSEDALRTALLAGSRAAATTGLPLERAVFALLVEQSFAFDSDNPTPGDLEKTPFFVTAAVGVARLLATLNDSNTPLVLSVIAGQGLHLGSLKSFFTGLAAAIVTRAMPAPQARDEQERLRGTLATVGEDLVLHDWAGPAVAELEGVVPLALVAGPAFADHLDPRVVLVRSVSGGVSRYDAPQLPRHHQRPRPTLPPRERAFADAGRGYAIDPGSDSLHWLAGPEEGGTVPFRDDSGAGSSGLAGLSRAVNMPAHALAIPTDADHSLPGLVWVAQSRAPIYLPLSLAGLVSPPIPWLTPGAPRPRNPSANTLVDALRKLDVIVDDHVDNLQAILPEGATIASVSDRAGISLARIARFETAAGTVPAFDERYDRFGRPAQGGSWSPHTERTPRPGPLPPNQGDEERDRRTCISKIHPIDALDAVTGPADRVTGDASDKTDAWSVTFVAAEEWDGMVTDSWDGTITLRAEVEVEGHIDDALPPKDVRKTLCRLLFLKVSSELLACRANLVIGATVIPFLRLHVAEKVAAADEMTASTPDAAGRVIRRGVATLVLDARLNDASENRGAVHPAIAAALQNVALPPVEVQLIVHPDSSRDEADVPGVIAFTVDTESATIVEGSSRAPVTLHMPLAPVVRSRGALPLAPTSILFIDPAYDAALSSAPFVTEGRLTEGAGPRGSLVASLYADRRRVNRKASITFMADVAYEKKLDGRAQLLAPNGDLAGSTGAFDLELGVVPKDGSRRVLFVAKPSPVPVAGFVPPKQPKVKLASVYELPLSALVETDGTAAALAAGDVLELTVVEPASPRIKISVLRSSTNQPDDFQPMNDKEVARTLRIILTDEPVVEPPPALYAALVRHAGAPARLSLPLYAQSPLPSRVDLRNARADFRRGLMRRTATFIWTLARPKAERADTRMYVVKADRNGQTHLPADLMELVKARPV